MNKKIKHTRKNRAGDKINGDYEGEVNNQDLPNGKGKCIFEDGLLYEGSWVNGKREGKGKMTFPNHDYYEGEWKNDAPNGKGKHYLGGEHYEGDFVEGNRHGKGTYKWIQKQIKYVGEFKNNSKDGFGKYYEGDTIYEGGWKNDTRYGKGKIILTEGSSISGFFNHTTIEGEAILKMSNGETIKGKYEDLIKKIK
jgi:hypothetical protein